MPDLLIDNDGAVRILTMNRPEKRNALNMALSEALLGGLRDADSASDVRAIVLTGTGPAFCAGADLSEFAVLTPDHESLVERRATLTMELQGVCAKLSKPVVTAVNGAAMGGGAGLAIGGDIAVMSETAKIGYPEVKRGIVAGSRCSRQKVIAHGAIEGIAAFRAIQRHGGNAALNAVAQSRETHHLSLPNDRMRWLMSRPASSA